MLVFNFDIIDFVSSYYVVFCYYLLEACSFLKREIKGVDPEDKGGGRS